MEEYGRKHVLFEGAECIRETEKGILVRLPDHDEEVWLAKSQLHDDSDVYSHGDTGNLIVSRWMAEQKDLL